MANEKMAATFSGSDDWPREADGSPKTELTNDEAKQVLANWPRRNGKAVISAYAMGHANGQSRLIPEVRDYDCAYRWYNGQMSVHSTGEQVWAKVAEDNPYATTSDERYAAQAQPRRDWTPTKGELGIAMGIVLFIIAIFCFIVLSY